jgi:exonuclease VII small subunit
MIDGLRRKSAPPSPPPPPPAPKREPAAPTANSLRGFSGQSAFEAPTRAPVALTTPVVARADGGRSTTAAAPVAAAAPAAPAAPTTPPEVTEAARAVDEAYQTGGAKAAAAELRARSEALNDPAKVDALIAAAQPTIDRISTELAVGARDNTVNQDTNRDVLQDLDATLNHAGAAGKEAVATSIARELATALPEGSDQLWQFDDALSELADDGEGSTLSSAVAEKLINDFNRIEAGNALLDTSVDAINEVRSDYEEKAEELSQVETRLSKELSQLGPALTPEEVEDYKEAFWARPENAEVRDEARAAGDRLSEALAGTSGHLETLAAQGDTGAKKALFESYRALAGSPNHADEAIQFVGRINQNANLASELREEYGDEFEQKLSDEILAPALPNAQAEAIAEAGEGGFDAAMERFSEIVGDLETAQSLRDIPGGFQQMLDDVRAIRAGTYSPNQVQDLLDSWSEKSPFGKALAATTFGLGLYDLPSQLAEGEYLEAIKNTLTSTASGIELTSGILNSLGKVGAATDVAKFGAKFLPLIGLGADAIQAYQDVQALRDGVSPGDVFNLAGSVVSLVGDVAGFVPVAGTAVDVVATFLGEALRVVGGLLNGDFGPDPDDFDLGETAEILQETLGLSEAEARLLIGSTQEGYGERLQELGLEPEQIRELLTQLDPPLFAFSSGLGEYEPLGNPNPIFETLAAFGVSGTAAFEFLEQYGTNSFAFQDLIGQPYDPEASLGNAVGSGDFARFREEALRRLPDEIADALRPYLNAQANTEYFDN